MNSLHAKFHAKLKAENFCMSTIAERILLVRGKMKQYEFANILDINPNTLRAYENGRVMPGHKVLEAICVKFSVFPAWLLLGEGPMHAGVKREGATQPSSQSTDGNVVDTSACKQCLELYSKLDTANERLYLAMRENSELKEKIMGLNATIEALKKEHDTLDSDTCMAGAS